MIDNLFYILVAYCAVIEIIKLSNKDNMQKYNKELKINLLYLLICIAGLFSSTWYCFLAINILTFIPKKTYKWCVVDSVFSALLLMASIIIKYHIL